MNILSPFAASIDVKVDSLFTLKIGKREDKELAQQLSDLVFDLYIINALRERLKLAHEAYQGFADHFSRIGKFVFDEDYPTGRLIKHLRASPDDEGAKTELADSWREQRSAGDFVDFRSRVDVIDPEQGSYSVLERLLEFVDAGKYVGGKYETDMNGLMVSGRIFLSHAGKVLPSLASFGDAMEQADVKNLNRLYTAVVEVARGAARTCDMVLKSTGDVLRISSANLEKLVPEPIKRIVTPELTVAHR